MLFSPSCWPSVLFQPSAQCAESGSSCDTASSAESGCASDSVTGSCETSISTSTRGSNGEIPPADCKLSGIGTYSVGASALTCIPLTLDGLIKPTIKAQQKATKMK